MRELVLTILGVLCGSVLGAFAMNIHYEYSNNSSVTITCENGIAATVNIGSWLPTFVTDKGCIVTAIKKG